MKLWEYLGSKCFRALEHPLKWQVEMFLLKRGAKYYPNNLHQLAHR